MSNRDQRRGVLAGHKFYRIAPLVVPDTEAQDGEQLVESTTSLIVDSTDLGSTVVVRVPFATSLEQAERVRHEVGAILDKPILVVTENVEFCSLRQCTPGEVSDVIKRYERGAKARDAQS